ncbi:MAG: aminotransferase class III-fold pyridoxal phosphate-dependent enzyme [Candidatus Omnitrophota bacterium]
MRKVIAIIQARMGSSRLANKVLKDISGKPMLWHVVERTQRAKSVNLVVLATSTNVLDDPIEEFAKKNNLNIFRGSEEDVLDRYYRAAKKFKADIVVRITGDCPLIPPEIIDKVVRTFLKGKCDFVTNTIIYTYPDGCDVEVFSFKALLKSWKESSEPIEREHVSVYIRNSNRFKMKNVRDETSLASGAYHWSVDRIEDLKFVREVYKHLYKDGRIFSYEDIIDLLRRHPEIKEINKQAISNEGYYRSLLKTPKIKPKKIAIKKSLLLKDKARKLIPGCSQTFSKGPSQFVQGIAPVFLEDAKGCRVRDVDGNEYIDYAMALGPVVLGYNYPSVSEAVKKTLEKGTTFTLPNRLEVELSEILCEIIPCAQMVRFGKNGSDVTSGAVRVARAYTGKDKVACCGYHGWQDWYIATTSRDRGIPEAVKNLSLTFEYNKIETLEKVFAQNLNQIACVIMEPVGVIEPKDNFLEKVKELTHKNGSILIFDEVISGFRFALGGAGEYFNVIPDLACFGKAMGNGFPISAVVGKKEIMKLFEEVFYSFTFGGEIVSIAAAIATIKELRKKSVIRYLWSQGRKIKDGFNVLVKEYSLENHMQCRGLPPRTVITFKDEKGDDGLLLKSLFQQECIDRGILFTSAHNICFSHSDKDIDYTLRVYNTVLEIIKGAVLRGRVKKMLKGEMLKPIFRKV